jgi:hypothetical protein
LDTNGYLFWIYMDIIWIWQAEALPGASLPAGECPAVLAAARGWAGQGGASG